MAVSHRGGLQALVALVKPGARLIAAPHLDRERRVDMVAPYGSSVAEIVAMALPGCPAEFRRDYARVTINGEKIPFAQWGRLRLTPRNDNLPVVVVSVMPGNSGIIRSALSIAVGVAALALGQVYLGPLLAGSLGFASGSAGFSAVTGLTTAGILLGGQLLVNALIPIRKDNAGAASSPTYTATGFRNQANIDGVVPCVYGEFRYAPPYAALPYTTTEGLNNYLTAMFYVSLGAVEIVDMRLGDAPLSYFKEVGSEIRYGVIGDPPLTMYPTQVLQQDMNVVLSKSYQDVHGPTQVYTATDATRVMLTVTFPQGLFWMHTETSGSSSTTTANQMSVSFNVEYRLNGAGAWTNIPWTIIGFSQKTVHFPLDVVLPARGAYQIQITRTTLDLDDLNAFQQTDQIVSESWLTAVRSYRPEYPINANFQSALVALKVLASKQLNGVIDDFNCITRRLCLDWNGSAWVGGATKNPASLFRYALQGDPNHYPVADSKIDLALLQDWHAFCAAEGLEYNRVHDFDQPLLETLADIAAAGRASPRYDGTKWGVVIDRRQTQTIAKLTPRNSSDFSFEIAYDRFPDAFRAKFYDKTNNYKQSERIVPWPGFVGTPAVIENLDLPGVVDPAIAWKEARKRQYEAIYRRETFYASQDWEGAIAVRGDLVELAHYALDNVQASAVVAAVSGNSVRLDNIVEMEAGGSYAIRFRRLGVSDSAPDTFHLRTISTVEGRHDTVFLTGAGEIPAEGDLISFGTASLVTEQCIVREREATQDFGFRFQLVPYAPVIFDLLDAEVPPPWDGRFGADLTGAQALDSSAVDNSQYLAMGWV